MSAVSFGFFVVVMGYRQGYDSRLLALALIVAIAIITPLWGLLWPNRDQGAIIAGPEGFTLNVDQEGQRLIPWNEIESVHRSWVTGTCLIRGATGNKLVGIGNNHLGDPRRIKKLAQAIQRRIENHT